MNKLRKFQAERWEQYPMDGVLHFFHKIFHTPFHSLIGIGFVAFFAVSMGLIAWGATNNFVTYLDQASAELKVKKAQAEHLSLGIDRELTGHVEVANTTEIKGWALDPKALTQAIKVRLYIKSKNSAEKFIGEYDARISRPDLIQKLRLGNAEGVANHGFSIPTPSSAANGDSVILYASSSSSWKPFIGEKILGSADEVTSQLPLRPNPNTGGGGAVSSNVTVLTPGDGGASCYEDEQTCRERKEICPGRNQAYSPFCDSAKYSACRKSPQFGEDRKKNGVRLIADFEACDRALLNECRESNGNVDRSCLANLNPYKFFKVPDSQNDVLININNRLSGIGCLDNGGRYNTKQNWAIGQAESNCCSGKGRYDGPGGNQYGLYGVCVGSGKDYVPRVPISPGITPTPGDGQNPRPTPTPNYPLVDEDGNPIGVSINPTCLGDGERYPTKQNWAGAQARSACCSGQGSYSGPGGNQWGLYGVCRGDGPRPTPTPTPTPIRDCRVNGCPQTNNACTANNCVNGDGSADGWRCQVQVLDTPACRNIPTPTPTPTPTPSNNCPAGSGPTAPNCGTCSPMVNPYAPNCFVQGQCLAPGSTAGVSPDNPVCRGGGTPTPTPTPTPSPTPTCPNRNGQDCVRNPTPTPTPSGQCSFDSDCASQNRTCSSGSVNLSKCVNRVCTVPDYCPAPRDPHPTPSATPIRTTPTPTPTESPCPNRNGQDCVRNPTPTPEPTYTAPSRTPQPTASQPPIRGSSQADDADIFGPSTATADEGSGTANCGLWCSLGRILNPFNWF